MFMDPMTEDEWLAERFEQNRSRLRSVAVRMLGSPEEAEDAVQEAWLRLSRSDHDEVANLEGWLTTVTARICLDMLRSRKSRREESLDAEDVAPIAASAESVDPEREAVLADSIGLGLLVVLQTLPPAERVAFVLHDMFDMPFDEIAPIVGRSSEATRQLASRARRRVRGTDPDQTADRTRQREVVEAFLAASRGGDFAALLELLDPNVVVRLRDVSGAKIGAPSEVRGPQAAAETFAGRARAAKLALIDGEVGWLWSVGGKPKVAFVFRVAGGKIVEIELLGGDERLGQLELEVIEP